MLYCCINSYIGMTKKISKVIIEPIHMHIILAIILVIVLIYIAIEVTTKKRKIDSLLVRMNRVEKRQDLHDSHVKRIEKVIEESRKERQQQQQDLRQDMQRISEQIFELATRPKE